MLIRGESGTGKELVARALHAASLRRDKPFVKVNCAALPTELLESELFGFERGAFTGAMQQKPGKFEFANHGTIFLDEIGEMSPAMQAKLLQVLQDGEFARLGGNRDVRVDVRMVAATNRDLEQAVANGRVPRGSVLSTQRRRHHGAAAASAPRGDPCPDRFLPEEILRTLQQAAPVLVSRETMSIFIEYDWPGNVRELENLMKRGRDSRRDEAVVSDLEEVVARRSPRVAPRPAESPSCPHDRAGARRRRRRPAWPAAAYKAGHYSLKEIRPDRARQAERELISRMLQQTHWNRKEAAETARDQLQGPPLQDQGKRT